MKQAGLFIVAVALASIAGSAGANCYTDTSQADFQAGGASNLDLASSPGDVRLSSIVGGAAIDQQMTTWLNRGQIFSNASNGIWNDVPNAQTFTAGMSGPLTRVDVNLYCYLCSATPPSITVSIRATSGGLPTGNDLATSSTTISANGVATWYTVNFPAPTTVSAGTHYAIVIRSSAAFTAGKLAFSSSEKSTAPVGNDVYPGGQLLYLNSGVWTVADATSGTIDGLFKTYVATGSSGYNSAGDLISSVKDGGTSPTWSTVSWNGLTPTSTALKFQAAASGAAAGPFNFVGPDGTSATYYTSGASLDRFSGSRYLKYRAFLSTTNSSSTPTLNDAMVCYTPPASADLSISNNDGVASVTAGGSTSYTLVATNNGPSNVTGATVADAFPSSLTCSWTCSASSGSSCPASGAGNISSPVNLLSGGSATFSASCAISAAASGTITNTASVSAPNGVTDPATANNTATDTDSVGVAAGPPTLSLTDNLDFVQVGDVVSYVIHVTNPGSTITPTVTDTLPAQLSGQSWICTASGGATCGNANGGNTLSDSPTLPAGGAVDYTFTANVSPAANLSAQVSNTASMKITGHAGTMSASDSDTVVVFISGFEGGATPLAVPPGGSNATGSVTAQFGVDGGLLTQLGTAPVTIANALSASGQTLFSLQLMRSGNDVLLRSLTTIDGGPFSEVSPWKVVDLRALRLGFEWQSATAHGDDGFLRAGPASQQSLIAANNSRAAPTQLQVTVVNGISWLVLVAP